ncbi:E3 ubiquitin-protein ligase TRIM35-like [Festucalex cinctus]
MDSQVEDLLHCPTCLEIFKDPVMLPCSHSFCRACVQEWWEEKGDKSCPNCRKRCRIMDVPSNLALRHVCEAFLQASVDPKEKLQDGLQKAKERLNDEIEARDICNEQATYIKVQREQVESKIKKNFEELRRFLLAEEEARLSAVREEEEEKSRMMKEKIEAHDRDIATVSGVVRSTEEQLNSVPVSFTENIKNAINRIQKLPDKTERIKGGVLLDEVKHVGNIKFSVWERMKETISYSHVILDPNTAGPKLSLSEDLTSVSCQEKQQRPHNPERVWWNDVLGSALASGIHTWDVEVGDNRRWSLGVVCGDPCLPGEMDIWSITCFDDKYRKIWESLGSWNPPVKLQRIRVHVDTNQRKISFSESCTNTALCNMRLLLSDSMKMFPYFWTQDTTPLQIIPLACHVTTQSP